MACPVAVLPWHPALPLAIGQTPRPTFRIPRDVRAHVVEYELREIRCRYPRLREPATWGALLEVLRGERIVLRRPAFTGAPHLGGKAFVWGGQRRIAVAADLAGASAVAVLAHELGHHVLGHLGPELRTVGAPWIEDEARLFEERLVRGE